MCGSLRSRDLMVVRVKWSSRPLFVAKMFCKASWVYPESIRMATIQQQIGDVSTKVWGTEIGLLIKKQVPDALCIKHFPVPIPKTSSQLGNSTSLNNENLHFLTDQSYLAHMSSRQCCSPFFPVHFPGWWYFLNQMSGF